MTRFDSFRLEADDALPRLAWCARIRRDASEAIVRHGPWVEHGDQSFYEGAWSGEAALSFDQALTFAGSGGRIDGDNIIFATPTNTLEPLHLLQLAGELLCSNSIHFLLAEAGDAVSTDYPYYDGDMMTIMFGTHRHEPAVPTSSGNRVYQYYHCNLVVSPDLSVTKQAKRTPPDFRNFEDYSRFLFAEVAAITNNAMAPDRQVLYQPMATISSGYDSPACAVIGRAAGCNEALTFTTARSNFEDREDSGATIAKILGLNITEFNYFSERPVRSDFPEAEFIATGHGGDDVVMNIIESVLPGRLLYTGYHGDKVWDKNNKKYGPHIVRGDTSGCSLAEFRLRTGFINLPVPFIGCLNHTGIHAISNLPEMAPWTLGNDYDRPIPRRIVEQAGVPRSLFGQKKKAITTPYQSNMGLNPPMEQVLCEASYQDFMKFIEPIRQYERLSYKLRYDLMHRLYGLNQRAVWSGKLARALAMVGLERPSHVKVPFRFAKPRSNNFLAFHWAAEKMKRRYVRP